MNEKTLADFKNAIHVGLMKNTHGGARPGSGRRKKGVGEKRVDRVFTISPEAAQILDRRIPPRRRSEFIDGLILDRLGGS